MHTKLGYEEAGVVWEITYTNEAEKLNYVYILFENGQLVETNFELIEE
ncbi:hypothetical protein [Ureibacillus acetophenoni]